MPSLLCLVSKTIHVLRHIGIPSSPYSGPKPAFGWFWHTALLLYGHFLISLMLWYLTRITPCRAALLTLLMPELHPSSTQTLPHSAQDANPLPAAPLGWWPPSFDILHLAPFSTSNDGFGLNCSDRKGRGRRKRGKGKGRNNILVAKYSFTKSTRVGCFFGFVLFFFYLQLRKLTKTHCKE